MYLAITHARHQRDLLLATALNALNRHRNQIDYGFAPTLTDVEIREVAIYAEALRHIPEQKGFPYEIVWPATPRCLKGKIID